MVIASPVRGLRPVRARHSLVLNAEPGYGDGLSCGKGIGNG